MSKTTRVYFRVLQHLTLTGITKGPKNRGREREAEVTREEEENIEINHMQIDSATQEQEHRQNSWSPILTLSPYLRKVHQEKAGRSQHEGSNIELMEMLKAMRQEMQQRDKQLQIQLQLRDEYMDAQLRIRDRNMVEALK